MTTTTDDTMTFDTFSEILDLLVFLASLIRTLLRYIRNIILCYSSLSHDVNFPVF